MNFIKLQSFSIIAIDADRKKLELADLEQKLRIAFDASYAELPKCVVEKIWSIYHFHEHHVSLWLCPARGEGFFQYDDLAPCRSDPILVCECGSDKARIPTHSSWCPKASL
jgi:hypothetical protein